MSGASVTLDDATAADTVLSIKERVCGALGESFPVHRQQLMYRAGASGIAPLADHETLGAAGIAQDGSAALDVLVRANERTLRAYCSHGYSIGAIVLIHLLWIPLHFWIHSWCIFARRGRG